MQRPASTSSTTKKRLNLELSPEAYELLLRLADESRNNLYYLLKISNKTLWRNSCNKSRNQEEILRAEHLSTLILSQNKLERLRHLVIIDTLPKNRKGEISKDVGTAEAQLAVA